MPFTFSHPFIVLPLLRGQQRNFSATGLIIGSMVPDFDYFIKMRELESLSHSLPGMVFFCLPFGFALTIMYHLAVRDSLICNLPGFLFRRLYQFTSLDWIDYCSRNYIKVLLSLAIGIMSHKLLDSFTHSNGVFLSIFPVLAKKVQIGGLSIEVYNALQVVFSLIGIFVLGWVTMHLKPDFKLPAFDRSYRRYWTLVVSLFALQLLLRISIDPEHLGKVDLLFSVLGCGLLSLLLSGIYLTCRQYRQSFRYNRRLDKLV